MLPESVCREPLGYVCNVYAYLNLLPIFRPSKLHKVNEFVGHTLEFICHWVKITRIVVFDIKFKFSKQLWDFTISI